MERGEKEGKGRRTKMKAEKDGPDLCGHKWPQGAMKILLRDGFLQENLSYLGGQFIYYYQLVVSLLCGRFVE